MPLSPFCLQSLVTTAHQMFVLGEPHRCRVAAHPWWVRLKQQLKWPPLQIFASVFICVRGWPGYVRKIQKPAGIRLESLRDLRRPWKYYFLNKSVMISVLLLSYTTVNWIYLSRKYLKTFFRMYLCETHTWVLSLQSDYHFEYTQCDVLGSRWRVAVPNKAETCTGLPDPVKGTQCSKYFSLVSCFYTLSIFMDGFMCNNCKQSPWTSLLFPFGVSCRFLLQRRGVPRHAVTEVSEMCCRHLLSGNWRGLRWVGQSANRFCHQWSDSECWPCPHRLLQVGLFFSLWI